MTDDFPIKCVPEEGYHVFLEGDRCECGERPRIKYESPPETAVEACARCGQNHLIRFKALSRPMVLGEHELTHWGTCSVTGEPVLMRFVEVG